jgi:hypothetical protein
MWKCCKQIKTVRHKEEDREKRSFFKNKIKNRKKKENYLQRTHFPWSRWRQHFQRRKHNIRGGGTTTTTVV